MGLFKMKHLNYLEAQSIYIIREAYHQFPNSAMLWSIGKDSTVLLHLIRKAFYGKIPFKVLHIDTSFKFKKMIEFRDTKAKEYGFNLVVAQNTEALARGVCKDKVGALECCTELKTNALKQAIDEHKFKALFLGIRSDEHGIRAKERVFSPRDGNFKWNYKDQPPELWDLYQAKKVKDEHIRVHPLLYWTEKDIWEYIKLENLEIIDMYFSKGGKRYRSLGCECCCNPVCSEAKDIDEVIEELKTSKDGERSGRSQDKESTYMMQKLRSLGYM